MEMQCAGCGGVFFTWSIEDQDSLFPLCCKCELIDTFYLTWHLHQEVLDEVQHSMYFEAIARDLGDS